MTAPKPRSAAQLAHDARLREGRIGRLGGKARLRSLTMSERSAIAQLGGWAKAKS